MKVLVIRFSSIGDIVLTTPVLRSLKKARPEAQLHFLTKAAFADLLRYNPHVDQLHLLDKDGKLPLKALQKEQFDFVLDLHRNIRSARVKQSLSCPSFSFDKKNLAKYRMVHSRKTPQSLPHIVERYGDTLRGLKLNLDEEGLELHLPEQLLNDVRQTIEDWGKIDPIAVVLGATYTTKRWPKEYFAELLSMLDRPVILLGGPDAEEEANWIENQLPLPILNVAGKLGLLESAALMKQAKTVIAHDTGFMHIAAAFGQKVISLWGNTVPEMGMTPYKTPHEIVEVTGLSCRPCSKIGYDKCPKGHFRCMRDLRPSKVYELLTD